MFTRTLATIATTLLICAGLALPARAQFTFSTSSPNTGGSVDSYASFDATGNLPADVSYAAFRASLAEMLSYILGAACGAGDEGPLTEEEWDRCGLDDEVGDYDDFDSDGERDDAVSDWAAREEWNQSGLADELGDYDDYPDDEARDEAVEDLIEKQQRGEDKDDSGDNSENGGGTNGEEGGNGSGSGGEDEESSSGIIGDDQPILGGGYAERSSLYDSMMDYHDLMDELDAELTTGFGVVFFGF